VAGTDAGPTEGGVMKTQNPSTSLGEGRDVAPSPAHPSQKQYLVVYTEDLTHLGVIVHSTGDTLTRTLSPPLRLFGITVPGEPSANGSMTRITISRDGGHSSVPTLIAMLCFSTPPTFR